MNVEVRRALYGKMAGDTTLTNMLGAPAPGYTKAIYFEHAPQGSSFPFVLFNFQSGMPTHAMGNGRETGTMPHTLPNGDPQTLVSGADSFDEEYWFLKGVDKSEGSDAVDAISDRIRTLLTDATLSISGRRLLWLRADGRQRYAEVRDGDTYRHAGTTFRLIHRP